MLALSIVLLILAAVCLFAEAHIPGFGFFGITGIILLVVSTVVTLVCVPWGLFAILGEYGLLGAGLVLFIRWARTKQTYRDIILRETLNVDPDEFGDLDAYLGREGVTKTSLRPVGVVDFDGASLEAVSDNRYIAENTRVKAVEVKNRKLIVKPVENPQKEQ